MQSEQQISYETWFWRYHLEQGFYGGGSVLWKREPAGTSPPSPYYIGGCI